MSEGVKKKRETKLEIGTWENPKDVTETSEALRNIKIDNAEFRIRNWLMQGDELEDGNKKQNDTLFDELEENIEEKMKQILRRSAAKVFWEEACKRIQEIHQYWEPKMEDNENRRMPGNENLRPRRRENKYKRKTMARYNGYLERTPENEEKERERRNWSIKEDTLERKTHCGHSSRDYNSKYENQHSDDSTADKNSNQEHRRKTEKLGNRQEGKKIRIRPYIKQTLETPDKYKPQPCNRCREPQHQYRECPTNGRGCWE